MDHIQVENFPTLGFLKRFAGIVAQHPSVVLVTFILGREIDMVSVEGRAVVIDGAEFAQVLDIIGAVARRVVKIAMGVVAQYATVYRLTIVAIPIGREIDIAPIANPAHIALGGESIGRAGIEPGKCVEGRGELPLSGQHLNGLGTVLLGEDRCGDGELVAEIERKLKFVGRSGLFAGER